MCGCYGKSPSLIPYARPKVENTIPRINTSHEMHWVECIKNGGQPASHFDYAGPFTESIVMGNLATRPDQALEELGSDSDDKFADWAVKLLAQCIGRFPIGSLVELSTGERGIVIGKPPPKTPADRPKVRLITDSDGNSLHSGVIVELSQRDSSGQYLRSIGTTLDPELTPVNIPHFFLD